MTLLGKCHGLDTEHKVFMQCSPSPTPQVRGLTISSNVTAKIYFKKYENRGELY